MTPDEGRILDRSRCFYEGKMRHALSVFGSLGRVLIFAAGCGGSPNSPSSATAHVYPPLAVEPKTVTLSYAVITVRSGDGQSAIVRSIAAKALGHP
jgi:hypothetical protein